jgi:hypothetical protein
MCSDVPETIRLKETELQAEERRVANFIEFVAEGRGSKAVAGALTISEQKVQELAAELGMLRQSQDRVFKAPPLPWIEERVATLQEVLERRTEKSALLLRKLLGKIKLEPVKPDVGRPYVLARSKLQTLTLLEIDPSEKEGERGATASDEGSNALRWWRRGESNCRTPSHPKLSDKIGLILFRFPAGWYEPSFLCTTLCTSSAEIFIGRRIDIAAGRNRSTPSNPVAPTGQRFLNL